MFAHTFNQNQIDSSVAAKSFTSCKIENERGKKILSYIERSPHQNKNYSNIFIMFTNNSWKYINRNIMNSSTSLDANLVKDLERIRSKPLTIRDIPNSTSKASFIFDDVIDEYVIPESSKLIGSSSATHLCTEDDQSALKGTVNFSSFPNEIQKEGHFQFDEDVEYYPEAYDTSFQFTEIEHSHSRNNYRKINSKLHQDVGAVKKAFKEMYNEDV